MTILQRIRRQLGHQDLHTLKVEFSTEAWDQLNVMQKEHGLSKQELIRRSLLQYDYELYLKAVEAHNKSDPGEDLEDPEELV